jgi:hypothetical protein
LHSRCEDDEDDDKHFDDTAVHQHNVLCSACIKSTLVQAEAAKAAKVAEVVEVAVVVVKVGGNS